MDPYCQQILSGLNYVEYKLGEHFDYKSFHEQFGAQSNSIRYMQEKDIVVTYDRTN